MGLGLTRKVGERIIVRMGGEEMTMEVKEIKKGNRVRLSFSAPESFVIHREEVAEAIAAGEVKETEPAGVPC